MSYQVIVSDEAQRDLRNIFEYISYTLKAPQSALNIFESIEKSVLSLDQMPKRYKVIDREPWQTRNVRLMPVGNFVVIYFIDDIEMKVNIIRIMYGKRDIDSEINF